MEVVKSASFGVLQREINSCTIQEHIWVSNQIHPTVCILYSRKKKIYIYVQEFLLASLPITFTHNLENVSISIYKLSLKASFKI